MNELLDLVPDWRGRPRTISALEGGLTNRNYRVDVAGSSYVLRIPGEETALLGIDRQVEAACSRAAAESGVGPDVLAYLPEHGALVRRFVEGRVLVTDDVRKPEILQRVVDSVRRYHDSPPGCGTFSPLETVQEYRKLARERGVLLPPAFSEAIEILVLRIGEHSPEPPCPCHNDLLAANLVDDGATVQIIDWEYAGMGDRYFDLGNLAANNEFEPQHEMALLQAYFRQPDVPPARLRHLRTMRLASDLREAAWGYLQAAISKLDEDYLGYAQRHLNRFMSRATTSSD
jgi:thiamine kinase-like enzyme